MQKKNHTLAQCGEDLDVLLDIVWEMMDDKKAIFYRCKVDGRYVSERSTIVYNPDFESGVVKIQKDNEDHLTRSEILAVKILKRPQAANSNNTENCRPSSKSYYVFSRHAKRQKVEYRDGYINFNFIFGFVALIKSLWSTAKFISTDLRSKIPPQMFESLHVLKDNIRYWDATLVSNAINMAKKERAQKRMDAMDAYDQDTQTHGDSDDDDSLEGSNDSKSKCSSRSEPDL